MADKHKDDRASPMDVLSGTSSTIQEGGSSTNCHTPGKSDGSQEESSGSKKDVNKNAYSPNTNSFPPSKLVFGSSCKQGSSLLAASRFGSSFGASPFSSKMSTFGGTSKFNCMTSTSFGSPAAKPVFLRPSQLAVGNESPQSSSAWNTFPVKSPALGNPFARVSSDLSNEEKVESSKTCTDKSEKNSDSKKEQSDTSKENCENESKEHLGKEDTSEKGSTTPQASRALAAPKFVPLGIPSHKEDSLSGSASTSKITPSPAVATSSTSTAATAVTGFVFGQNLHERVVEPIVGESVNSSKKSTEIAGTSSTSGFCSAARTNGTSEMLFTSVLKKDQNSDSSSVLTNNSTESADKPSKSLSEAAREYEEARAVKRKYEEVAVVTGEEGEANVLQMNCKLFAFDSAGNWVERGRGTLRLNDKDDGPGGGVLQSRVVIRTTGSLRVVLNTKIWADMTVDQPSPKSVRLTAMDNTGQIKVFLIMASPKETEQLFKALESRVLSLKQAQQPNSEMKSGTTGEDVASRSLPSEPSLKKRPTEAIEDTGGGIEQKL